VTLVVDATIVVHAALAGTWTEGFRGATLAAPTLMWSEVAAAIRQLEFRDEISRPQANSGIAWLEGLTLDVHPSRDLATDALELARKLGWAKTYDAEYVVLAQRLRCALVTADARLRATAASLIPVVGPTEVR
jgi:predicted nucleic acid-binding protein